MKIKLHQIKIREIYDGFRDNDESGVYAYGGRLNIRPPYQREFVYNDKQRDEVIQSIRRDYPLNVMYWARHDSGEEGEFGLIDGQQRTLSICHYIDGAFSIMIDGMAKGFSNLTAEEQKAILDYPLQVYICDGTDKERLEWFRVINVAGEVLTAQELRNANYTGPWLSAAKRYFSKKNGAAYGLGEKYLNGRPIRQEYLERALIWKVDNNADEVITKYMADHQFDKDAEELWQYFQNVIEWTQKVFPNYRAIMKGLEWGRFYNKYKDEKFDAEKLEARIVELIDDDEVGNAHGIYEYLLSGDEKTLNLRAFDDKTKVKKYEEQGGICPKCGKHFEIGEMEADHIVPWHDGGKTTPENCQMLCRHDNRVKSGE